MLTDFFKKYRKRTIALFLSIGFIVMGTFCSAILQKVRIDLNKKFYFLVSSSTHIEASTHFVEWSGGAGYLLENAGNAQVVFSVYLKEEDGVIVQSALTEETELLTLCVDSIYLYKKSDKKKAKQTEGAFQTLYNCCEVLEKIIGRVARGGTQESGKRLLEVLQAQLSFLRKEYAEIFPKYAEVCKKGEESISRLLQKTIYLKDLRYMLCELCVAYVQLASSF